MEQGQFKGDANNKKYTHKTPSFIDYHIVIAESDIFLQMSVHKLGNVTSNCGLITTNKTKTVTFRGIDPSKMDGD
jgi:ribosomal protein L1